MLKAKSKSQIFMEAWQIAKDAALRWGGSARSYLAAALREIYAELRKVREAAARSAAKEAATTNFVYEVMIAIHSPSTTIIDQAVATVLAVVSKAVAKVSTIASKTFGFIRKVCDFGPINRMEVALE